MKKRILSVLLVVAMLASMVVMPAYAAGTATQSNDATATKTDMTQTCPCGCGKTFAEITWTDLVQSEWTTVKTDKSGHYRLTDDWSQTAQLYYNGTASDLAAGHVVIDLAGKTVTAGNARNFNFTGTSSNHLGLTIIDSVGGATVSSAYTTGAGSVYAKYATINLYGGTFQCCSGKGAGLYCVAGGVINVYAPTTVYGGDFVSTYGAIAYVNGSGAELNIHGGTIIDGSASKGDNGYGSDGISINNGTVTITGGSVGTVKPLTNNATVSISGEAVVENLDLTTGLGTVTIDDLDETASIGIDAAAGAVNATIDDVQTYLEGGNISSGMSYADLSLNEGVLTMSDSTCPHCGKAYSEITWTEWTNDLSANVKLSGDTNHYYLTSSLTGKSKKIYSGASDSDTNVSDYCIDMRGFDYTTTAGSLYVYKNQKLAVCDSVGGAILQGKTSNSAKTDSKNASTVSSLYVSDGGELKLYDVEVTNNQTTVYDGSNSSTVGGYAATKGLITLVSAAKLEANDCTFNGSAAYYGGVLFMNNASSSATFTDCVLNGCDVTGSGSAIYASNGSLTLKNTTVNGAAAGDHGGAIYATTNTVTIEGGTINGGTISTEKKYGGAIYLTTGTLDIDGATINGGTLNTTNGYGAGIYSQGGSISIKNAVINGGTARLGGAIDYDNDKTTDDTSETKLTIENSTISGGNTASNGAVLALYDNTITSIKNSTITGGTAGAYGGVAFVTASATITVEGCTVTSGTAVDTSLGICTNGIYGAGIMTIKNSTVGDISSSRDDKATNVYLQGEVNGNLHYGDSLVDISEMTGGNIAVIGTPSVFTTALENDTAANEYLDNFTSGVTSATVKVKDAALMLEGNPVEKKCPHCGETVEFKAYIHDGDVDILENVHYYLYQSASADSEVVVGDGADVDVDVVIDLNGNDITSANRAFVVKGESELYLFDETGESVVTGGHQKNSGAAFSVSGKLTLHGGTYTQYVREEGDYTKNGGVISVTSLGKLIVEDDAVISGGTTTATGGNIYATGGATVTIQDNAQVIGGSAQNGGNIYATGESVVNIKDNAQITDGSAQNGGNIYAPSGTVLNMTGGTVSGGTAKIDDETLSAKGRGGNIYLGAAEHTISGGTISGGISEADGSASGLGGGNIYIYSGGKLTVSGGATITGGTSGNTGGNIFALGALVLEDAAISGGTATVSGADIYIGNSGSIEIALAVTGDLGIGIHDDKYEGTAPYGKEILGSVYNGTDMNSNLKLTLDGVRGNAPIYAQDGALWVQDGGVAVVDIDDNCEYFANPADAVDAFDQSTDMWLMVCGAEEIVLTKDAWIDVNGCDVTVSGAYSASFIDTSNADYETFGWVTLNGASLGNANSVAANGTTYYTVMGEDGRYSFHLLDMEITAVSLKTRTGGLYYDAKVYCDDTMKGQIDTFGIATQLGSMPTDLTADSVQYSYLPGTDLVSGKEFVGLTMNYIIVDASLPENADKLIYDTETGDLISNDARGEMKVYAAPYACLKNGDDVIGTTEIGWSLKDCCSAIDTMIGELLAADPADEDGLNYQAYMTNLFTNVWKDMDLTWTFINFPAVAEQA